MSRLPRTRTIVACAAVLSVVVTATSCAAILGIDDVSLKDAGSDTGSAQDASFVDVSSTDANNDGGSDATSRPVDYATAVLNDKPIAYWKLDDFTSTAVDSAPHHLDATYAIGLTHGPPLISEPSGGSARFPGSPDGGRFGPGILLPPALQLAQPGPLSVEAWIRPFIAAQGEIVTYGQQATSPFQPWGLQYSPPLQFYTSCCDGVNGTNPLLPDSSTTTTYYLVATFDQVAGTVIYVNAVQDGVGGTGGVLQGYDGTNGLGIGSGPNGELPFTGLIDEVAVYDKVLTLAQIQTHYATGTR